MIFNDYMDFKIKPWGKHGYDKGKMYPIRKTALRLLKKEIVKQKQEDWDRAHNVDNKGERTHDFDPFAEQVHDDVQNQDPNAYAVRETKREILSRTPTAQGERVVEQITNKAEFRVPTYEDVENWNDDSWIKFAAPFELEEYYTQHPERKPAGWISPTANLKTREEIKAEKKKEKEDKLRQMNSLNSDPDIPF